MPPPVQELPNTHKFPIYVIARALAPVAILCRNLQYLQIRFLLIARKSAEIGQTAQFP